MKRVYMFLLMIWSVMLVFTVSGCGILGIGGTETNTNQNNNPDTSQGYQISGFIQRSGGLDNYVNVCVKPIGSDMVYSGVIEDRMTGKFKVTGIPASPLGVELIVFWDFNTNNVYTENEPSIRTNIIPFANNISGLIINLGTINYTYKTIYFISSNNVYSLPIGFFAIFLDANDQPINIGYTTPDSATNIHRYLLPPTLNIATKVVMGIYYDTDYNGKLSYSSAPALISKYGVAITDPILTLSEIDPDAINPVYTNTVELQPFSVKGQITGPASSGFTRVWLVESVDDIVAIAITECYASAVAVGGNYEMKFYLPKGPGSMSFSLVAFKDDGNKYIDNVFGNDQIVVWHNRIDYLTLIKSNPSTNTCDFNIYNTSVSISFSGTDANLFKFVTTKSLLTTNYHLSPLNFSLYNDNYGTSASNEFRVFFFKDDNGNNIFDITLETHKGNVVIGENGFYDTYGVIHFEFPADQASLSKNLELKKLSAQVNIVGSYSSYNYPRVWFVSYFSGSGMEGGIETMIKLTNQTSVNAFAYYVNEPGWFVNVGIVNDTNQNGANSIIADMSNGQFTDPYIATNSAGSNLAVIFTNTNINMYIK